MAERSGPGSFRRRTGLVLAWLGAFLLATGIMLRAYVYHHVAVLPVDAYAVTTLHATGVTYFDPAKVATRTGLRVTATSTLRGDANAAQGDTAVYDTFLAVKATDGTPIEFVQTRLALNRHTGLLVNCCEANVAGNTHLNESGLGFKFPFFAQKTSYEVFDSDVRRPVPAAYAGQTSLDGLEVYKYVQVLPASQIGSRLVPQSIMGLPQRPVQVRVRSLEATTMTYWVDPVTGAPVKVEETPGSLADPGRQAHARRLRRRLQTESSRCGDRREPLPEPVQPARPGPRRLAGRQPDRGHRPHRRRHRGGLGWAPPWPQKDCRTRGPGGCRGHRSRGRRQAGEERLNLDGLSLRPTGGPAFVSPPWRAWHADGGRREPAKEPRRRTPRAPG